MENKTIRRFLAINEEILLGVKQAQTELKTGPSISLEDVVKLKIKGRFPFLRSGRRYGSETYHYETALCKIEPIKL